ncbi:putative nucleoside-diphosphate-sugar epimerase [Talaromyces proteolyticus]|uniref:Nucleoside-diphosphate-sugar epimerase n=1 Tax=Talaromyces proteolyticus TaxID=1131652 RepID=A0AAD4KQV1_9EURO|nr:putative nucleoside-diphosphate-sugar epimerase [Talaromyces proteolyticus]KAH8698435.1 putative nucleoside-diphosphate-sugar epimerase [Talaromyces proteolyticus]
MKLVVAGSTGFVGTEVIRQAVSHPSVNTIVALARRPTPAPENAGPGADVSKIKSVVCEDFENYPESVKKEIAGADACIWLIAITPGKLKTMPFEQTRKICLDYTAKGLEAMAATSNKPFRFIYTSGAKAERDQSKKPWILGDYSLMRGQVESHVLNYAKQSAGAVQACITRPGIISAPGRMGIGMTVLSTIGRSIIGLPKVEVSEIATTMIEQAVNGIEKETLLNEDLVRIGQKTLAEQGKSS